MRSSSSLGPGTSAVVSIRPAERTALLPPPVRDSAGATDSSVASRDFRKRTGVDVGDLHVVRSTSVVADPAGSCVHPLAGVLKFAAIGRSG